MTGLINGLFFRSAKNAAVGNVEFLHELASQLYVPPADCLKVAQQLTDATFVCPLGGEYQLQQAAGTLPTWISTKLPADKTRLLDGLFDPAPADFTAPILQWLRQLDADAALDGHTLSINAVIEMQQNQVVANSPSAPPAGNGRTSGNAAGLSTPPRANPPPPPQPAGGGPAIPPQQTNSPSASRPSGTPGEEIPAPPVPR